MKEDKDKPTVADVLDTHILFQDQQFDEEKEEKLKEDDSVLEPPTESDENYYRKYKEGMGIVPEEDEDEKTENK